MASAASRSTRCSGYTPIPTSQAARCICSPPAKLSARLMPAPAPRRSICSCSRALTPVERAAVASRAGRSRRQVVQAGRASKPREQAAQAPQGWTRSCAEGCSGARNWHLQSPMRLKVAAAPRTDTSACYRWLLVRPKTARRTPRAPRSCSCARDSLHAHEQLWGAGTDRPAGLRRMSGSTRGRYASNGWILSRLVAPAVPSRCPAVAYLRPRRAHASLEPIAMDGASWPHGDESGILEQTV